MKIYSILLQDNTRETIFHTHNTHIYRKHRHLWITGFFVFKKHAPSCNPLAVKQQQRTRTSNDSN